MQAVKEIKRGREVLCMHKTLREFSQYGATFVTVQGLVQMTPNGAYDLATRIRRGDTFSAYVAYIYFSHLKPEDYDVPMNKMLLTTMEEVYGSFMTEVNALRVAMLTSAGVDGGSIKAVVTYPELIADNLAEWAIDGLFTFDKPLPDGSEVTEITYNGTPVPTSELDLGGLRRVYLSDLIDSRVPTRNILGGHADRTDSWTFKLEVTEDVDVNVTYESIISDDDFDSHSVISSLALRLVLSAE